jgi:hypothetical protein
LEKFLKYPSVNWSAISGKTLTVLGTQRSKGVEEVEFDNR